MMRTISRLTLVAAVAAALGAASAYAEDSGPYIAGAVGQSRFKIDGQSGDNKDTSSMFSLGYRFNQTLGLELGYSDYGKAKLTNGTAKANAGSISAVVSAPLTDGFSIYGRLGVASTRRDVSSFFSTGDRKTEAIYGIGMGYAFNKTLTGTLEWHKLNSTDVSALNVGLRVNF